MNWYLLVLLSSFGLVMGLLAVQGLTQKIEFYLWLVLGVFASLSLARNVAAGWFWHAVLVGVAWGVLNSITQSVFFETYAAHNAAVMEQFAARPAPVPHRYFVLITGPVVGLVTGLVLAGLTFVMRRLFV